MPNISETFNSVNPAEPPADSRQSTDTLLEAAMGYAARGWPVFPLKGKKPYKGSRGFYDATTDKAAIRDAWGKHPDSNIGLRCGAIVLLDIDGPDGRASLAALEKQHGALPPTRRARSGRADGGAHFYFVAGRLRIPSRAGMLGPGLDVKAQGGYAVLPPSIHPDTKRPYVWENDLQPAPIPAWLAALMMRDENPQGLTAEPVAENAENSEAIGSAVSAISVTDIDSLIQSTLPKKPGERNACLLRLARGLKFDLNMSETPLPELKVVVRRWYSAALSVITTKDFDTTWADFLHAFRQARYAIKSNVLDNAFALVDPENLPAVAADYDSMATKMLIGFCFELGKVNRGRFFLSSHVAARKVNLRQSNEAYRLLKMLCSDGVIETVAAGNRKRANRYRWIGGK